MLPTVVHLVATAEKSILPVFQSWVSLGEKQTTAYFVWLNIDLFSRKSIITEFRQNVPPLKLKISGESRNVALQNEKTWTDEKYQILKNNIKIFVDNNLSDSWPFICTI